MKTRLVGLDSLRGIAALALIIFHVRGIPTLECPLILNKIIDHLGSGVPLFYAISAFSLMLGYEARLSEVDGLSHFYIRRFFRIIPLFYTMLCFWLIVRAFYFHASTSFSDIALNTSCLFGLLPQSHEGLVWASWSIGVEWIFYIFFPILMLMASTLAGTTVLFIASIAISVASMTNLEALSSLFPSFGYMAFSTQLVFFTGGILAFKLGRKILLKLPCYQNKKWLSRLLVFAAASYLALLWNSSLGLWLANKHLGTQAITGGWILLLAATLPGVKSILDYSLLQRAGKLSFSLYLRPIQ